MTIKNISYSESIESINDIGLKRWVKIGAEIEADNYSHVDEQFKELKEIIKRWKEQSGISPNQPPVYVSAIPGHPLNVTQVDKEREDEITKEFEAAKKRILESGSKELAEAIMIETGFTLNVELKQIANSKLSKK